MGKMATAWQVHALTVIALYPGHTNLFNVNKS